ncbi:hypothetical protein BU23DRAFT_495672 [Bimuria novae-zelandiae CBS 107.79]|uniref:CUE domain-containing protein n=1 Tax=Bimuria novae-zelandiae CBS 107.79 TaxID=1447943 RepID=A0A6A5VUM8_9PLEO|nr:hypothetical protein BU23DRAFT_495672 [Bimuria novae-zelandiae CBS 107.79]
MTEQTLNIPQILVFLVVTVLVARWWLNKPGAAATPTLAANRRINPAQIDQLAQIFPQLDRRTIAWNLQRNGGNPQAITETMLGGRSLQEPPVSFQLPPSRTATPTGAQRQPASRQPAKPSQPDLITRYNLMSKVGQAATTSVEEQPKGKAWSQDRNERQANLQRRREEMILAARLKMEEKAKAEQKTG